MLKIINFRMKTSFVQNKIVNFINQSLKYSSESIDREFIIPRPKAELEMIRNSSKHLTFRPQENRLYQFDNESKSITDSDVLKAAQPISWREITPQSTSAEILMGLRNLQEYCTSTKTELTSEQFDGFVDIFVSRAKDFNVNELLCALQIFVRFPMNLFLVKQRNFAEIIIALDEETTKKAIWMTLEQLIFLCGIWAEIPKSKTFFPKFAARQFNTYNKVMTSQQLTQAILFLNYFKRPIEDIRFFENVFENQLNNLDLKEISIIFSLFMRVNKHIAKPELRSKLLKKLSHQDDKEYNELEDFALVSILWNLQKSTKGQDGQHLIDILKKLDKVTENKGLRVRLMTAHVGIDLRICNERLVEKLLNDIAKSDDFLSNAYMADLISLSRIIGVMDITTESKVEIEIMRKLLQEARNRIEQSITFNGHINHIRILNNLSMKHVYDLELLENLFRKDYLQFVYKRNKVLEPDLYKLDTYCRLNLAHEYDGELLDDVCLSKMGKFLTNYFPREESMILQKERFTIQVSEAVVKKFSKFKYANAVASYKHSDLHVCVNKITKEPVDVFSNYPPDYSGQLIYARSVTEDRDDLEMYAFVPANSKLHWFASDRWTGVLKQKFEQLELLGYTPILISFPKWKTLSHEERLQLIEDSFEEAFRQNREKEKSTK